MNKKFVILIRPAGEFLVAFKYNHSGNHKLIDGGIGIATEFDEIEAKALVKFLGDEFHMIRSDTMKTCKVCKKKTQEGEICYECQHDLAVDAAEELRLK